MGRYAIFANPFTGRFSVMDTVRKRKDRMKDRIFAWCKVAEVIASNPDVKRCMITLTYDTLGTLGVPSEWSPLHIREFMKKFKQLKGLKILAYAWVLELQASGVPHYHVILIYHGVVPYPDKSGMWLHGMSNIKFKLRTVYYIAKYLGKEYQKDFEKMPKGARVFAVQVRGAERKEALAVLSLSPQELRAYNSGGWEAVEDMHNRPEWARSRYVASTHTRDYADFLLSDLQADDES